MAIAGVAGLAAWIGLRLDETVPAGTDATVLCLLGTVLMLSQLGVQGRGSRWLAWRPLVALGEIPYGVYLWQQLFLGPHINGFTAIRTFPVGLLATFTVAGCSYWFLEKPLLRLKDRRFHTPITNRSASLEQPVVMVRLYRAV
jgi:peptidoglycan/LPS O-acetylase OafA/YrhL